MTNIDATRMTLGEHCQELRARVIRALIGVGVGMAICLIFGDRLMQVACWPAAVAMQYRGIPIHLRVLSPAESFTTYVKVCLICGAIVAAPYSLRQLWLFVAAGLHKHESDVVRRYAPFSAVLFFAGVAFFFVVIAPICISFFIGFAQNNYPAPSWASPVLRSEPPAATQPATTQPTDEATIATPRLPVLEADPAEPVEGQIWIHRPTGRIRVFADGRMQTLRGSDSFLSTEMTLSHYMTFVAWLALVFGIGFQTPICVMILAGTGLVALSKMKAGRKYVLLAIAVIAAVLTPPDVVSQVALGVPMYFLFELGLLLAGQKSARSAAIAQTPPEGPRKPESDE